MKVLQQILFGLIAVLGLSIAVSAQKDGPKKPPPKDPPPVVNPQPKPPPEKPPSGQGPKKPGYAVVVWKEDTQQA